MINRRKEIDQKDQAHREELAMIKKQKDTAIRKAEDWKQKILKRLEEREKASENGTDTNPAVQAG
jgi:hypothetical protein